MEIRDEVKVTYNVTGINKNGDYDSFKWSSRFDLEMYEEDIDLMDVQTVNYKVQDYKNENGDFMVTEFTIDRHGYEPRI